MWIFETFKEKWLELKFTLFFLSSIPSAPPTIERISNSDGQTLVLPGTGVTLQIPDDAFEDKADLKSIDMRIIHSRTVVNEVIPFCSNPFMSVELLPIGLRLRHPAKLRLPHRWIFKENKKRKARIFFNQEKGKNPSLHKTLKTFMNQMFYVLGIHFRSNVGTWKQHCQSSMFLVLHKHIHARLQNQ